MFKKKKSQQADIVVGGEIPEVPVTDYSEFGVLKGPIKVPYGEYNGRKIPGWQTQRDTEGRLHTDDDKPSLVHENGLQEWHTHGVLNRDNGPARIHPNGIAEFWQEGRHVRNVVAPPQADKVQFIPQQEAQQQQRPTQRRRKANKSKRKRKKK